MAGFRRYWPVSDLSGSVALAKPLVEVAEAIDDLMAIGEALLEQVPLDTTPESLDAFRASYLTWDERSGTALQACFRVEGFLTANPVSEFKAVGITLLDLKLTKTSLPAERLPEVVSDVREKIRILHSIRNRLDLWAPAPAAPRSIGRSIFLVHGQDLNRREAVRRFIESITDTPVVVLEDQANEGRDVLGKLLDNASEAAFAVVLMTPDDEGRRRGDEGLRGRARQNVVLELGLFLGMLGRNRVVALYDESVEMPSDYSGVAWIPVAGERWMLALAKEMKSAGIDVSVDRAL